jgi:hypothetical protein
VVQYVIPCVGDDRDLREHTVEEIILLEPLSFSCALDVAFR